MRFRRRRRAAQIAPGNRAKLTVAQAAAIKAALAAGRGIRPTARAYGLPVSTVQSIATGQSWGWLSPSTTAGDILPPVRKITQEDR